MYTLDQVGWGQIPPDHNTGIQYPPELQISDALTGDNAHVTQNNAARHVRADSEDRRHEQRRHRADR